MTEDVVIHIEGLRFAWPGQAQEGGALVVPAFSLRRGEHTFLQGPSGCGKSTLLGLIAGLQQPQAGRIEVLGQAPLSMAGRDRLRAEMMGIVFQQFNLLPYLSVMDNVLLAARFSTARRMHAGADLRAEAARLLTRLSLAESLWRKSALHLSVGQQQRVAIARALFGRPPLVLADEPTSALDAANAQIFVDMLLEEADADGATVLMVSHAQELAQYFRRTLDFASIVQGEAEGDGEAECRES
jgi:putative ABC transport system ATP-binding protein